MQRRVVQAKIQYYRGKDDECRASLESLDAEGKLWSPASHDESSYGQVLVVQARCLFGKAAARGLYSLRYSCRHLFRIIAALLWGTVDAYSKLLKSIYAAPPALPRLLCEQNETTAWVEEALYRACFSLYDGWRSAATKSRRAFRDACTDAFRLYLEWASFQSFDYRPLKRISVLRNYIFHLALTCRCWNYRSPAMVLTTTTDSEDTAVANAEPPFVPRSLNEELSLLLALYESIVTSTISFPRADSPNQVVENLYDDITFIYCLFGFHESPASLANAATSQYELLLEAYFRATGRTFRSRSVMRRIGWTATLAEALEEAMMGFKMYLEKDKKDKRGEWWMRDPEEMAGETMDQVVGVLIAVTRMCLESLQVGGGSHGGACDERIVQSSPTQTQSAVIYAEKAVDLCRDAIGPSDSVYLPLSLYYLGITYSRLGIESRPLVKKYRVFALAFHTHHVALEHEHFHLLQEQSLIMLLEAERLDPNYWRFHYNLALQYEEMGLVRTHVHDMLMANL